MPPTAILSIFLDKPMAGPNCRTGFPRGVVPRRFLGFSLYWSTGKFKKKRSSLLMELTTLFRLRLYKKKIGLLIQNDPRRKSKKWPKDVVYVSSHFWLWLTCTIRETEFPVCPSIPAMSPPYNSHPQLNTPHNSPAGQGAQSPPPPHLSLVFSIPSIHPMINSYTWTCIGKQPKTDVSVLHPSPILASPLLWSASFPFRKKTCWSHKNKWERCTLSPHYYRKRGSASYIVREWLLWEGERERDACDVNRYHAEIASDHAYDYLDGAQTQRVDAFWACRVLEVHVHVKTRSLALERSIEQQGRVIDEWRWGSGSFASPGQPAVDHPAAFRWHASSKKNRPSWCLFPFRMAPVLPLRRAWIADILWQASLRDGERKRCWKRGSLSGDGQRLWDYCTARLSDLSMPLTSEVRRSPEPSARPSAAADSDEASHF